PHARSPSHHLRPPCYNLFPYTTLFRSGMKSQLIADETHQPLAIDEVDELWNAVEIMRERFFNEEMTPRPGRREGHRHVQAVWIRDRKSTRLNSSHEWSSYAVFCLKKKK